MPVYLGCKVTQSVEQQTFTSNRKVWFGTMSPVPFSITFVLKAFIFIELKK